jgi:predicted nucleic acid-binding protein
VRPNSDPFPHQRSASRHRIALLAADLHREHKLATADAIVCATALNQAAELLTCDGHFEGLPQVLMTR